MPNINLTSFINGWPGLLFLEDKKNLESRLEALQSLAIDQISLDKYFNSFEYNYINYTFDNNYNFIRKIDEIKSNLKKLEILELVLSFNVSHKKMSEIVQKLRQSLDTFFIVDLKIDKDLIGGVKFGFRGKWYDYSLTNWINQHTNF